MVISSSAALVVRDGTPRDAFEVSRILVAAFTDSPLGCWLDPDAGSRPESLLRCIAAVVTEVMASGVVRVVEDGGRVVAAAVWSLDPSATMRATEGLWPDGGARASVQGRWKLLDEVAQTRRPLHLAHQQLVLLGVRPDRQGEGLSNYLLIGHHALLDVTAVAAYALADDPDHRLLRRHGYTPIGPARLLPGRVPVWVMWRPPSPADAP